jgi:hypothetical protein
MDYPESYLVADTIARDLRARLADLSADTVTLNRDEAVLIVELLDATMRDVEDGVRRTNGSRPSA